MIQTKPAEEKLLTVSASPHERSSVTSVRLMLDVIISLCPALIASVIIFGLRALAVTAVTVVSCVLSEYVTRKIMKRSNTIGDLSAIVTGILLAFNLPATIPFWIAALGGAVAIVVVKQMFGGIGQNFVNPAITARIVLLVSFASFMSNWPVPRQGLMNFGVDAVTGATPLAVMAGSDGEMPTLVNMLLGVRGGCLGETCAVALLIGGLYLVARKVISPAIPLTFIGTVAVIMLIAEKGDLCALAYQLLSGGLLLGAIFMATDYATSPISFKGKIVFGIGCGIITCLIRIFGSYPEGVSFSIIIMNILVPHIEKLTTPKPFGTPRKEKKAKEAQA
jgi:electron transport complex protein RnfD